MHLTVVLVKVAQDNKIVEENSLLGNKNHRIHRKIMFNQIIIVINNTILIQYYSTNDLNINMRIYFHILFCPSLTTEMEYSKPFKMFT